MRFACSMSRSIDPRRPWFLTPAQSASVNKLPCIVRLTQRATNLSEVEEGTKGWNKYLRARRRVESEKKRQRRLLLVDLVDRFKKEQPIIDSERQLSGGVVIDDTREELQRSEMTPEHLHLIDAILTLPETTFEKELTRRIAAINAITMYCGVEEGHPSSRGPRGRATKGRPRTMTGNTPPTTRSLLDDRLRKAILSVTTDKRPLFCWACVGNPALSIRERVTEYATPGSVSRHFLRMHVRKLKEGHHMDCHICKVRLQHRQHVQSHGERSHGTVSRLKA
jgi:hypothetical protein